MRVALLTMTLWLIAASVTPPDSGLPQPDDDLAVELLRRYLQLDTTNPPGNELRGALFFRDLFAAVGIPAEVDEYAPGRANLLAVLKCSSERRPLILLNHMDVVPAEPSRWSVPPFSGLLRDGVIYGRGAEDMKTEGILQAVAFMRAKRDGLTLDRDLIFLATAGEEDEFSGAVRALSSEGWRDRLSQAEYLITEGGENVALHGRPAYFSVAVQEKAVLWLTLRATGTPGHAAQPTADSAPNRLIRALERIRTYRAPTRLLPVVERYLRGQAGRVAPPRDAWYRNLTSALQDADTRRVLERDKDVWSLLHNTVSITAVRTGYKTNVIPGTAEAELDVRLLPGEDPHAFLTELKRVIDDSGIDIRVSQQFRVANQSPTDTELYQAIERVLGRHYSGVPVLPKLLTGATESVLFRSFGLHCYGFTPLLASVAELESGHGDNERVSEAAVREASSVFYDVVREVAARR